MRFGGWASFAMAWGTMPLCLNLVTLSILGRWIDGVVLPHVTGFWIVIAACASAWGLRRAGQRVRS